MDIEYLLALQGMRQSLPGPVELFFLAISYIADGPGLIALALVIYWCVDKRMGLFAVVSMAAGNFVNQLAKNIACVYRPWIRDPRVVPAEAAIEGAGGYSFPSGHTTGATTVFGSIAWLQRRKHKAVAVACVLMIVLIGFSRNLLGVHTPQDVLVGLLIGVLTIALVQVFFNWIERYDALMPGHNKDLVVLSVVIVVCAVSVAVVLLKPYPLDYVDGQLLVDPEKMQKGSFEAAGVFMGLAVGWVLERRFVAFTTGGVMGAKTRAVRFVVGVGLVGFTYVLTDLAFKAVLPYLWAKLVALFCVVVVGVFAAPLAFRALERKLGWDAAYSVPADSGPMPAPALAGEQAAEPSAEADAVPGDGRGE